MAISTTGTLPPFPYTGTFTSDWISQPMQQYIYRLNLSPGSYQISVLPDLLTLTTAVGTPTVDDINMFTEEAFISGAYIARTVNYYDERGLYYSGESLVARLYSKADTLAAQAMEGAGYFTNYGEFDYYDTTVTIEAESSFTSGTTRTVYTGNYYLYVEGWNYSYTFEPTGAEMPLSGRFLVTLGNPTGQRTSTWGGEWLNVQNLSESYTPPVTPPPTDDSSSDGGGNTDVMQQVVGQIPTSSAWSTADSNGQTFSPAYVIGADGSWYQEQSADGTAMTDSWRSGIVATQLYDNLSESVYKAGLSKADEYWSKFGLPSVQFVSTYEDAQAFKTILKDNSSRVLGIINEGMQGVLLQAQGGNFDVEAYWDKVRYAGRDCLKDIGSYISEKVFGSNTTASTLVTNLQDTSLDIAYSDGDSATIRSSVDKALQSFLTTVAVQAASKYELVANTIDMVGAKLKIDVEARDAAKMLADASELGAVVIENALPYTLEQIESGAKWLGIHKDVPLQEKTVNSVAFGLGTIGGTLAGAAMSDVLLTGDVGGTLNGGGSNDLLVGGDGTDTAEFTDNRAAYSITNSTTHTRKVNGSDGNDTLFDVERFKFADGTLAFDTGGGETAGEVYRLYKAAFNRTPDSGGLKYWIGVMDGGTSLDDVAGGFVASAEFTSIYGVNQDNSTVVTRYYQNVLGRQPEQLGYDYWMGQLNNGLMTRSEVLAAFSESAENQANLVGVIQDGIWLA